MALDRSINLLLPPSAEEVRKVEVKSTINVSSVIVIFVIVFVGVIVLFFNLYFNIQITQAKKEKAKIEGLITNRKDTEYRQRLLNDKWISYTTVRELTISDYESKIRVLRAALPSACTVDGYSFSNDLAFSFQGTCNLYSEVLSVADSLADNDIISQVIVVKIGSSDSSRGIDYSNINISEYAYRIEGYFSLSSVATK
ncbi:hypothetical protein JW962_01835 [Candidatus Dojkabacteria bacterium]|nr:hypothetical protein [Candidatus Dojkabacteria bacterium]